MSVVVNLGILAFFKYTDFVITNINNLFGASVSLLQIALPIGISFYTFQTLSYTIDVYLGKAQYNKFWNVCEHVPAIDSRTDCKI